MARLLQASSRFNLPLHVSQKPYVHRMRLFSRQAVLHRHICAAGANTDEVVQAQCKLRLAPAWRSHELKLGMLQVEIKLRLPNKEAHDKVAEALKASYIETHDQENFFFEGSEKELNKAKVSLRTRFYGVDKKCQITMKVRTANTAEHLQRPSRL